MVAMFNEKIMGTREIPHFHINELREGKRAVLDRLAAALVMPGFIAVTGLEDQLPIVEANKSVMRKLIALPPEVRDKYITADAQRGIVLPGREVAKGFTEPDAKTMDMMVYDLVKPELPQDRPFGPNLNVKEVPGYLKTRRALMKAQYDDALIVLTAIERAMGLPPGTIVNLTRGAENIQRGIFTPGKDNSVEGAIISAPHEDINYITALWPEPGLLVYLPDSSGVYHWYIAGIAPGAKVYNTGEMVRELWCARAFAEFVPTKHAVISDGSGLDRMTFPFFLHGLHSSILREGPFVWNGIVYPNMRYGPYFGIRMVELKAWDLKHRPTFDKLMKCGLLDYMPEHQVYQG